MTRLALTVLCLILISQLALSSELGTERKTVDMEKFFLKLGTDYEMLDMQKFFEDARHDCGPYMVYCHVNGDCPRGMKCYVAIRAMDKARIILLPYDRVSSFV